MIGGGAILEIGGGAILEIGKSGGQYMILSVQMKGCINVQCIMKMGVFWHGALGYKHLKVMTHLLTDCVYTLITSF